MSKPSVCPCGAKLWSREELLAGDDYARSIGEMYVDDESGYCYEEDEVVPYEWIDRIHTGVAQMNRGEYLTREEVFPDEF